MDRSRLIECVPNFSEGRDPEIVAAIRRSILENSGAEIWDRSSDKDHNRSVFTLAGSPEDIEAAVMAFTAAAAALIDMRVHEGVHPCIGATDVVPFVPLKNTTMAECVELSEKVGKRIASELGLPVYLYANSAKVPSHRRLADIRRGGYAKLAEVIALDSDRAPDFGPKILPPAGGVSVGARDFLIAFNIFLNTSDTAPAKKIAKKIRESSGGFPGVQAIGLPVNGLAQVSMNFLNYRRSSLISVFNAVRTEAEHLGCALLYSELIGMLPKEALSGTSPEELMLRDFDKTRILETHF